MTDKQIIIDEQMENLNNLATQQLKRIEEEKRQIEHIAKTHLVETFDMQREIDKLKKELQAKEQECEELKEELNKKYIREGIKTYCPFFFRDTATCLGRDLNEIGQLKFCRKYHNCWIKKIAKENIQLKATLTEIKEIASKVLLNTHDLEQFKDADALFGALLEIHKKISEVEDD